MKQFSKKELTEAMARLAKGQYPKWMNSLEAQAYVLGIITDEDIVDHPRCNGRGWMPSHNPYSDGDTCSCPGSCGKIITELGKSKIKVQFPEYKIRDNF